MARTTRLHRRDSVLQNCRGHPVDVRCLGFDETQYFSLAGRFFLSTEQTIDVTKFSFIQGDVGRAPTSGLS